MDMCRGLQRGGVCVVGLLHLDLGVIPDVDAFSPAISDLDLNLERNDESTHGW